MIFLSEKEHKQYVCIICAKFQVNNSDPVKEGWSGGAIVLGKLPVPRRPTYLDNSRARAYCACNRCGWGLFGHFYSRLSFLSSPSLWETAQYRLKYCLKGPLNQKKQNQPTNPEKELIKQTWHPVLVISLIISNSENALISSTMTLLFQGRQMHIFSMCQNLDNSKTVGGADHTNLI